MSPLISIIVPVYNVEKYLRRCMDSIVNQTLSNIEIICVNDGTKDNSVSILNEYASKDKRIKIIHKKNGGLSSARNEGMKYATAEYIGFVDSDDWIEPDTYELAYKAMVENNVDLVCWYAQIEVENGLIYDNNEIQKHRDYHKINNIGFFKITDEIFINCTVTAWNKLYKKSIIIKYNFSFPHGLLHEDIEFFFKYASACQSVYFIDKYLIHYLQRSGSIMLSKTNNRNRLSMDRIKIMKRLYQYYVKYNFLAKYKKTISKTFIWDCFASDCWSNSRINQFYIYWYASKIVRKMDLSLLEDLNNILFNLKERHFTTLFYIINNITIREFIFSKLRRNIIYRIIRKLYHQTSYYKIKTLQQKHEDTSHKVDEINKWLNNTDNRIDETNKWLNNTDNRIDETNKWLNNTNKWLNNTNNRIDETNNWLNESSDSLQKTHCKLEQMFLLLNQLIKDHTDKEMQELCLTKKYTISLKTNNFYDTSINQFDYLSINKNDLIIEELNKLDEFYFCPNNGNLGDVIIAEAEYQLFLALGLKYSVLDLYNDDKINHQLKYSNYVYGGGGLFNELYNYKNVKNTLTSKHFKKIIILPSSFYKCDDLIEAFDERFIIFCREEQSFKYCTSKNKKAKFILSHDMVFNLDYKLITSDTIMISNMIMNHDKKYSFLLYESYCYYIITHRNIKKKVNEKVVFLKCNLKLGIMLRTDKESNINKDEREKYLNNTLDLSSFGWFSCTDAGMVKVLSLLFIESLNYFDIIITDRLHIGIISTLLGKRVYLLDNNYGKLSGVYKQSMSNFPNVRVYKNIFEIEKEIGDDNLWNKIDKINELFNKEMTFVEFLSVYLSAYNPDNTVTKTFLNTVTENDKN